MKKTGKLIGLAALLLMAGSVRAYSQTDTLMNDTWKTTESATEETSNCEAQQKDWTKSDRKDMVKMDDIMEDYSYADRQQLKSRLKDKINLLDKKIDKTEDNVGSLTEARDNLKKQMDKVDQATPENWDQTLNDVHSSAAEIRDMDKKSWEFWKK
ncbi:MAG: hypothetical protein WC732_06130 [Candidatus Omnitrophota bacterium]